MDTDMLKRIKTKDVAYKFRMSAGYPGDVTRTHPVDINAEVSDATNPPTYPGLGVLLSSAYKMRMIITSADYTSYSGTGVNLYGIVVRTFPTQQAQTSASNYSGNANYGEAGFGANVYPMSGVLDVLKRGNIMVYAVPGVTTALKGGAVYIWTGATAGAHILGGFEATNPSTNGILVNNAYFDSGADANGIVEIAFNI
jgi:hypothetical protein